MQRHSGVIDYAIYCKIMAMVMMISEDDSQPSLFQIWEMELKHKILQKQAHEKGNIVAIEMCYLQFVITFSIPFTV